MNTIKQILENIEVILYDWYGIYEMSTKRGKTMDKISGLSETLVEHLLKLLFFKGHRAYSHWTNEVRSYIRSASNIRVKPKNKPLKSDDYFDALFDEWFGPDYKRTLTSIAASLSEKYKTRIEITDETVNTFISFFGDLSDQLSKGASDKSLQSLLDNYIIFSTTE